MKRKFAFILSSFFLSNFLFSQNLKVKEPEFSGQIIYVNDSVGDGQLLEQQKASASTKMSGAAFIPIAGAFSKGKGLNVVKGLTSPIKIHKQNSLIFIVSVSDNKIDPVSVINIFPLKQGKDTRYLEVASASITGAKVADLNFLSFRAKKYGDHSYLITLENVSPGEYAMTLESNRGMFNMFSVID
ncbi:MAG: hypothetical protein JST96_10370 [Bacteroidetes bacterium]|nr:hypothetical protein [Bacteroidota bacterium]